MKDCKFEEFIDDYLLNRLAEDKKDKFEEHYFNCPSCFEKMMERDELIRIVKRKGDIIFEAEFMPEKLKGHAWAERIFSFLTPKQWAFAGVAAALILLFFLAVLPKFNPTPYQFQIGDETVRGGSIELISPLMDINAVPTEFRWAKSNKALEYKISIYTDAKTLWTDTTKENFIVLPEKVRSLIQSGETYSWQVKAFSAEGTVIAVSSKVYFKVVKTE